MQTRLPLKLRRHYSELSEKETDALVGVLADLIVTYLKKRGGSLSAPATPETQEVRA